MWWHKSDDGVRLVCDLCPRHCALRPGERGFCSVREHRDGAVVSTTYGRSTGFCIDPIEKKPLNQFYPGTAVLSFGTPGCNLGCTYCQNWTTSRAKSIEAACEQAEPQAIAASAVDHGCRSVAFTYNDPIIWAEYAIDTAKACHAVGIQSVAVTSGYISAIARKDFYDVMDAANVDLKGFTEEFYRDYCRGHLQPVLDTLRWLLHESRTWLEITNLVIPGANDSADDIGRMCQWIAAELGPDVPLHFSAFHPDFKLMDRPRTPPETLEAAYEIARRAGLHYVYTGNVIDPERQNTYCPGCGRAVIRRDGYVVSRFELRGGRCAHCETPIAGRFDEGAGKWGGKRMPVRIKIAD
jgi:pyruvate formate lyase activating enzyme